MKTCLMAFVIMALAMPLSARSLIQKPGLYASAQKSSELSIQAVDKKIKFDFKYTAKDGRKCSSNGIFDSSVRWAFLLDGENKVWIYRGENKVLATELIMHDGPLVSFSAGHTILQLDNESDRSVIPKELLRFIDNAPPPSP